MSAKQLTAWTITEGLEKYAMTDERLALRARVAQLEAALKHAQEYMRPNQLLEYGPSLPEMFAAPQSDHLTDTSPEGVAEIKRVFEHCGEDTCRGFVEALIDALERERARVAKLEAGLQQSVELQSHYAELLNMHDGGQRLAFANAEAWLDRLAVLKDTPQ